MQVTGTAPSQASIAVGSVHVTTAEHAPESATCVMFRGQLLNDLRDRLQQKAMAVAPNCSHPNDLAGIIDCSCLDQDPAKAAPIQVGVQVDQGIRGADKCMINRICWINKRPADNHVAIINP